MIGTTREPRVATAPSNAEITVLVVDDEPIVREVVATYLRREGWPLSRPATASPPAT